MTSNVRWITGKSLRRIITNEKSVPVHVKVRVGLILADCTKSDPQLYIVLSKVGESYLALSDDFHKPIWGLGITLFFMYTGVYSKNGQNRSHVFPYWFKNRETHYIWSKCIHSGWVEWVLKALSSHKTNLGQSIAWLSHHHEQWESRRHLCTSTY